jgi:hypothetical protein
MPATPATQDAEIRGLQFKASSGKQKKLARFYLKNKTKEKNKAGMVVHACNPTYSGSRGRRITV